MLDGRETEEEQPAYARPRRSSCRILRDAVTTESERGLLIAAARARCSAVFAGGVN